MSDLTLNRLTSQVLGLKPKEELKEKALLKTTIMYKGEILSNYSFSHSRESNDIEFPRKEALLQVLNFKNDVLTTPRFFEHTLREEQNEHTLREEHFKLIISVDINNTLRLQVQKISLRPSTNPELELTTMEVVRKNTDISFQLDPRREPLTMCVARTLSSIINSFPAYVELFEKESQEELREQTLMIYMYDDVSLSERVLSPEDVCVWTINLLDSVRNRGSEQTAHYTDQTELLMPKETQEFAEVLSKARIKEATKPGVLSNVPMILNTRIGRYTLMSLFKSGVVQYSFSDGINLFPVTIKKEIIPKQVNEPSFNIELVIKECLTMHDAVCNMLDNADKNEWDSEVLSIKCTLRKLTD